ncbi:DUF6053 domain-containing protein [Pseudoxanthomonas sp. LARHCG66]
MPVGGASAPALCSRINEDRGKGVGAEAPPTIASAKPGIRPPPAHRPAAPTPHAVPAAGRDHPASRTPAPPAPAARAAPRRIRRPAPARSGVHRRLPGSRTRWAPVSPALPPTPAAAASPGSG